MLQIWVFLKSSKMDRNGVMGTAPFHRSCAKGFCWSFTSALGLRHYLLQPPEPRIKFQIANNWFPRLILGINYARGETWRQGGESMCSGEHFSGELFSRPWRIDYSKSYTCMVGFSPSNKIKTPLSVYENDFKMVSNDSRRPGDVTRVGDGAQGGWRASCPRSGAPQRRHVRRPLRLRPK